MPVNLTDADTWTTTVQSIANGEALNAVNLQVGPQDLADRSLYLRNRNVEAVGGRLSLMPYIFDVVNGAAAYGTLDVAAGGGSPATTIYSPSTATSVWQVKAWIPTRIGVTASPPTVTSVSMVIRGDSGLAGLPSPMPRIYLASMSPSAGQGTLIGSQTDATAVLLDFKAPHAVTFTPGSGQSLSPTGYLYVECVIGDGSNNSADLLDLYCTIAAG